MVLFCLDLKGVWFNFSNEALMLVSTQYSLEDLPGYLLWKDMNSSYLQANGNTTRLFGFANPEKLIGITDYDIKCEAAEYADLFVAQDNRLKAFREPLTILDVHPYINGELKILLINKSIFKNAQGEDSGIACNCIEVTSDLLIKIGLKLANHCTKTSNQKILRAANYFFVESYDGLKLSKRQTETLFYLIRGKSCSDISTILNLSRRTVETYVESIKDKMRCNSKSQLIEKAIELGYVDIIPKSVLSQCLAFKNF